MPKADNMLSILWLLKTRRRVTAKQLAEALEIHVRSVYRYIDALCASGVPIVAESGPNGGYTLLPSFRESPLFFDLEEQKALVQAAVFAKQAGYPHEAALERAVGKLKRYATAEQRDTLDRHAADIDVISASADDTVRETLRVVEEAIQRSESVDIEYEKGYGGPTSARRIDPYGLVVWRSRWYVVAHCRLRDEVRSFRADRIRSCVPSAATFARPEGFSARRYFMQFLLPKQGDDEAEELVEFKLRGDRRAIDDLCLHWLFAPALVERTAEEATFRMDRQWVRHYVPYTLIAFGTSIAAAEPPALVDAMLEVLERLRPHYEAMRKR
ncbi:YafY family protein [Paenibacillus sp.]|uniref:helix-turn-helix transcriptional regulator n=1 Tax=Paenibacillus sp. TaxID=58172 RepID=UPI002D520434|nr:YafY family protein [Paenibacillus sp.]HZG83477.1 YafY family protein [Paenibacillus sp.]